MAKPRTTTKAFDKWDYAFVSSLAQSAMVTQATKAQKYYDGDHWQEGEGWRGPKPDPLTTSPEQANGYMVKVRDSFTSANTIKEVVDRHVSAVIGRSPSWQMVRKSATVTESQADATEEQAATDPLTAEIEAAITEWADKRGALGTMFDAAAHLATTGRGVLRLFIPTGRIKDGAIPNQSDAAAALDLVYFESIEPAVGGVVTNVNSMQPGAYVIITTTGDEGSQSTTITETQYTDDAGQLVMKTWDGSNQRPQVPPIDMGGLLMVYEMNAPALVTEQLMQLQGGMNFSLTAMGKNNSNAGFIERVIMNAQPPGDYVPDPANPKKQIFRKGTYQGGPGATTFLTGHPFFDENNQLKGYTTPAMERFEPASPDSFTASTKEYRTAMYMEVKQGHLLVANDGSASAASRIQLRADFETSLKDTKDQIENAFRWLLSATARVAAVLMGTPKKYDELRPSVQATIDTGPLSDLERQSVLAEYKDGVRSRETTMVQIGIEDPDAEMERIAAEQPHNPVPLETLALFGIVLTPEQIAGLMKRAGIDQIDMAQIVAGIEAKKQADAAAQKSREKLLNPDIPAQN